MVHPDGLATDRGPASWPRPGAGWLSIVTLTGEDHQARRDLITAGQAAARRPAHARILLTPAAEAGPVRPDRGTLTRGGPVVAEGRTGAGARFRSSRRNRFVAC